MSVESKNEPAEAIDAGKPGVNGGEEEGLVLWPRCYQ
jgi:hypothetical protein